MGALFFRESRGGGRRQEGASAGLPASGSWEGGLHYAATQVGGLRAKLIDDDYDVAVEGDDDEDDDEEDEEDDFYADFGGGGGVRGLVGFNSATLDGGRGGRGHRRQHSSTSRCCGGCCAGIHERANVGAPSSRDALADVAAFISAINAVLAHRSTLALAGTCILQYCRGVCVCVSFCMHCGAS